MLYIVHLLVTGYHVSENAGLDARCYSADCKTSSMYGENTVNKFNEIIQYEQ